MTRTLPNGRQRTLDLHPAGQDGSGRPVWIVFTTNRDGSTHLVERFKSKGEAINWVRWA